MSKFFFKGRIELPSDYSTYNYNTDPSTKHGSKKHPISITVTNEARQAEIESQLKENNIFANITLDSEAEENIGELEMVLNKPTTLVLEKTPNRNDPCSCGSGKKYKKCCG
jgi:SWIM/SEC-C metal-binding protein|tara:strand:- start:10352 stop:10684 length:333 start_codon:yes stop_codon:yes gene_type:complete